MKKTAWIVILIIAVVIVAGWWAYASMMGGGGSVSINGNSPQSASSTSSTGTMASGGVVLPAFDQSISDGVITIHYPSGDFGLATTQQQVLVTSYIPPCDPGFTYCLYYQSTRYHGTNFGSAGIAIRKRTDLSTETQCLTAQPAGFSGLPYHMATSSEYGTSVFPQAGQAAAGHFSSDTVYRLSYQGKCYDFDVRVSQSDFYNYPSGSIQQFTDADTAATKAELGAILGTLTLPNGQAVSFPAVNATSSSITH